MVEKFELMLSDGSKVDFNPEAPNNLFKEIVMKILIPFYSGSNDWYQSIRTALTEIASLRMRYGDKMPNIDYRNMLLKEIESSLGNEIDKIKGVDQIEILFLNLDDYTEEISELMKEDITEKELIRAIGDLIAGLNTFEMSELLFHYIKKSMQN
jgi:hypothetical protein